MISFSEIRIPTNSLQDFSKLKIKTVNLIHSCFEAGIKAILSSAVDQAMNQCTVTVKGWEIKKIVNRRAIMVHWSTYRAICSRSGIFVSKGAESQNFDWNETL